MEQIKQQLIKEAKEKHKPNPIFPCGKRTNFNDCFTIEDNALIFWYDTKDKSSHIIKKEINN